MEWRGLAVLGVLLAAGCAEIPPVPEGIPVGEHGEALPTVRGLVVDGAIRPLPGVVVRLLGTNFSATTDEDGAYAIHRPTLQPEQVVVSAAKHGFLTRAAQVQVSGHIPAKLNFRLDGDPNVVPHVDVFKHRGAAGCMLVAEAAGQRQDMGCDDDEAVYEVEGGGSSAPSSMWDVVPTLNFAGMVVQVDWEASTQASSVLHARLRAPLVGGNAAPVVAEATGTSPLRLEIPAGMARDFPRWTAIRLYVELAPPDGMPVAAGNEQPFEAIASLFYVDPAPPGYTLQ